MANTSTARPVSTMIAFLTLAETHARHCLVTVAALFVAISCMAQNQDQSQPPPPDSQTMQASAAAPPAIQTIPAGTSFALVLTHPIQSRFIHRGDDIYAQITAPITLGNEVVIPPGSLVDGKVDKLERRQGRGELHLQSLTITFPDGYVVPVPGPAVLETVQGYALTDPGSKRVAGMFILPAAGAGLGALIGHSIGKPDSSVTSNFPPGCIGGPPFCTPITTPVSGTQGRDTAMGAGIGIAVGAVGSMILISSSHHFFLDVGSPVDMVLRQPLVLDQNQVSQAVRESEQHPVAEQPIAPRPLPPPPSPDTDHGTCYTPGTPGTPTTVLPGTPGPDGVPGPPTIVPGTPPSPGTPYPCP